ncbi:hypothetical protein VCHC52A1_3115, partial [Vibrio cholerae HC-52A1]
MVRPRVGVLVTPQHPSQEGRTEPQQRKQQ